MTRTWTLRLCGWLLLFVLVACQGGEAAPPASQAFTVTDALGRAVQFDAPPQQIIIAGKATFMIINAAYLFPEARERMAALSDASQYAGSFVTLLDPEAEAKTRFKTDASAEEIAAAKPDLVLLKSYMKDSLGDPLGQLGIPVVYLDLETPEQYERDLATLGQIFANPERAREVWGYYSGIMDRVAKGADGPAEAQKPRVLILQYSDKGGTVAFKVPPTTWIQTQMVTLAGGVPVWSEAAESGGWAVVNLEQIAVWNPDQIYVINYFGSAAEVVTKLLADSQWAELAAARAGQIAPFPADFHSWDQPDSRWGLGLLWLAQHIQPERFADVDVKAEVYTFFETYYGLDRATIDAKILSLTTL
ncbi:MAG: ABC transporter substrate-binding protein [Anaerolineae bacterium]|nr:ABC transporter substrate-binding protein [Anaerolineae bacterium]